MLVGGHTLVCLGQSAPVLRRLTVASGLTDSDFILLLIRQEAERRGLVPSPVERSDGGKGNHDREPRQYP